MPTTDCKSEAARGQTTIQARRSTSQRVCPPAIAKSARNEFNDYTDCDGHANRAGNHATHKLKLHGHPGTDHDSGAPVHRAQGLSPDDCEDGLQ